MGRSWRLAAAVVFAVAMPVSGPAFAEPVPGLITEYPLPTPGSAPTQIAAGPDGNMWFTELDGNRIGKITPSGQITEYTIPTPNSRPSGIAAGPDGNMWFTELDGNKIGKISPSGQISEYPLSAAGSSPFGIAAGPDGNMWFTEQQFSQAIGKITPSGQITEYTLPGGSFALGIAKGSDDRMWFAMNGLGKVGTITTSGQLGEFPIWFVSSSPVGIAQGPDANMWVTASKRIVRISPAGTNTLYDTPDTVTGMIAAGPDGNMWFTNGSRIGRISTAGTISDYVIPTPNSFPRGIAAGSDGNMWFVEQNGNRVGRVTTGMYWPRPALSGTGQVGQPLVCGADVWGDNVSRVEVGWQRNGTAIPGQEGPSYTPSGADLGARITCTSSVWRKAMLIPLTAASNPITVAAAPTGSTGTPPAGQGQQDSGSLLAAVLPLGSKAVKAGSVLKMQFASTSRGTMKASLQGRNTKLTRSVSAKPGTNTLAWRLPKSLKAGKYTLRLSYQGVVKARTSVKVTR